MVELAGVFEQRAVATLADRVENRADDLFGLVHARGAAAQQAGSGGAFHDAYHQLSLTGTGPHSTILLSGYSTMPCAPASFRRGMILRTVASSRIVLTASHSPSLNGEMVGFFNAGSTPSTLARSLLFTFSIRPTLPSALMAPSRSIRMSSILRRFQSSLQAPRLAMNCVLDSITVSMMRSLLARSDEPVSVTSTIASASTGGFTSVAPQENSTLAVTPNFAK